ncbi:MAG: zf-HC2 domain-containing protein [Planctomycetota bacterium]
MGCEVCVKAGAYLDHELPAREREAYEAHLSTCAECAQELARLERLSRFLSAAGTPEFSRPQLSWNPVVKRQKLVRFAEALMAAAGLVMAVCGFCLLKSSAQPDSATVAGWERMALTQQAEAPPAPEPEDPIAQAVLRGQP